MITRRPWREVLRSEHRAMLDTAWMAGDRALGRVRQTVAYRHPLARGMRIGIRRLWLALIWGTRAAVIAFVLLEASLIPEWPPVARIEVRLVIMLGVLAWATRRCARAWHPYRATSPSPLCAPVTYPGAPQIDHPAFDADAYDLGPRRGGRRRRRMTRGHAEALERVAAAQVLRRL